MTAANRLAAEQAAARRRERWILLGVLAGLVAVLVAGGIGLQAWRTSRAPAAVPVPGASAAPVTITAGRPVVFGEASVPGGSGGVPPGTDTAPVVVTLFSDFHCPHCAEFDKQYAPVLDQARQTGRARVELYPMAFVDEGSAAAANAFACAAEAGFGPGYYAGLFSNRTLTWNDDQLVALAGAVGGTASPDFTSCVTSQAHAGWVDSINAAAAQQGVTGTPTLFVNGTRTDVTKLTPDGLAAMINP
jgi:protein-disulfide isomerase